MVVQVNNDEGVSDNLVFFVNGKKVVEGNPCPEWTLVYYLRNKLMLCGTKEACGDGGCGACTVMISRVDPGTGKISNLAVNACLTPLCSVHGAAIVTIEGIGSVSKGVHPIQERLSKGHGVQCGFCSPGFSMSTYALLRNNPNPSEKELEAALQGNLCRCTGYRPILEGLKTFCGSANCCKNNSSDNKISQNGNHTSQEISLCDQSTFKPYDASQDPIFPPELLLDTSSLTTKTLRFTSGPSLQYFCPSSLEDIQSLKKNHQDAIFIAGGTDKSLRETIQLNVNPNLTLIQISCRVPELSKIEIDNDHLVVGAAVTFSELEKYCKKRHHQDEENEKKLGNIFHAFCDLFPKIGDLQLRNVSTVGGAIVCKNKASDFLTFLIAAQTSVSVLSANDKEPRTVQLSAKLVDKSGGFSLTPSEFLTNIKIPLTNQNEYLWFTKRSNRKYSDMAITNAAIKIKFESTGDNNSIHTLCLTSGGTLFGQMVEVKEAENHLQSRILSQTCVSTLSTKILEQLEPDTAANETKSIMSSILQEFVIDLTNWRQNKSRQENEEASSSSKSSSQLFQIVSKDQSPTDLIGRPTTHLSAIKSATGEATFVDDLPPLTTELFADVILSTEASAKILSVDTSEALALDGVVAYVDHKSLKSDDHNTFGHGLGPGHNDEEFFRKDFVTCHGQIIGLILAKNSLIARKAAALVKVTYDVASAPSPILTMEEAIDQKSFYTDLTLQHGDVNVGFDKSEKVLEGQIRSGGQKHMYLEPHCARATPTEDGGVDLVVTTQSPSNVQQTVAHALGLPANKVMVRCPRIGGGFGGREIRGLQLGSIVSVAAVKHQKPVRITLTREKDMEIVGGRHPFLTRYKVGFNLDGRINAIQAEIYSDAGSTTDLSVWVMDACMKTLTLSYKVDNWDLHGHPCRTNLQSNTAFRGFGGPQGCMIFENIIQRVADSVGIGAEEIRRMHLYQEGDVTPVGFPWDNCTTQRCWDECKTQANLNERMSQLKDFNAQNKLRKRGIAMTTCSQAIGLPAPMMNQAGALVMIYNDGSVSLNHGGIEMGQGIHTKMVQIASRVLAIPMEKIDVPHTATDKVPNTIVSAASITCDLNGPAVVNACEELNRRLEPIKKANPSGSWEDWIMEAYNERVNLSAVGFNKLEFPHMFNYITFGVGCSEVEINCLTGEQKVLRTDIVMDLGESLNPAIDIGQMEGGFVQGMGLFSLEELTISEQGKLTSTSTATYKIPTLNDIPQKFNVSILRGAKNPRAVFSSKAVGEPPLYLGLSVLIAAQNAIKEFRKENNLSTDIFWDAPLTPNDIRKACQVNI